jgi:hypothetical protein
MHKNNESPKWTMKLLMCKPLDNNNKIYEHYGVSSGKILHCNDALVPHNLVHVQPTYSCVKLIYCCHPYLVQIGSKLLKIDSLVHSAQIAWCWKMSLSSFEFFLDVI